MPSRKVRYLPPCPSRGKFTGIVVPMALMFLGTGLVSSLVLAPPRSGPALQARRASAPAMLDIPRIELPSAVSSACAKHVLRPVAPGGCCLAWGLLEVDAGGRFLRACAMSY